MNKVRLNQYVYKEQYYEVILTNFEGKEIARAKVGKKDLKKVQICRWGYSNTTKTTQGFVKGHNTTMHQIILGKRKGKVIDHINHDRLDNRRQNLRYATKSQNAMNRGSITGITKVLRANGVEKWVAQIMVNYKHISLGVFMDKQDAINARKQAEVKYFGKFAYK